MGCCVALEQRCEGRADGLSGGLAAGGLVERRRKRARWQLGLLLSRGRVKGANGSEREWAVRRAPRLVARQRAESSTEQQERQGVGPLFALAPWRLAEHTPQPGQARRDRPALPCPPKSGRRPSLLTLTTPDLLFRRPSLRTLLCPLSTHQLLFAPIPVHHQNGKLHHAQASCALPPAAVIAADSYITQSSDALETGLPGGWEVRRSNTKNLPYYFHAATKDSRWEPPAGTDSEKLKVYMSQVHSSKVQPSQSNGGGDRIRCAHLLVKHKDSRRPASWREAKITRDYGQAEQEIKQYQQQIQAYQKGEGGKSLSDLATTESDCSSARKGGDL